MLAENACFGIAFLHIEGTYAALWETQPAIACGGLECSGSLYNT